MVHEGKFLEGKTIENITKKVKQKGLRKFVVREVNIQRKYKDGKWN